MKQNHLYCMVIVLIIFGQLMIGSAKTLKLPNLPVVNLVICNDCSEDKVGDAIGFDLLSALMEKQLVICTKKLFNTLSSAYEVYKNNETYKNLQKTVKKNKNDIKALFVEINKNFGHMKGDHEKLGMIAAYDIFLAHGYMCKELEHDYLLFIPPHLCNFSSQKDALVEEVEKILGVSVSNLGLTACDLRLGMKVAVLTNFDYTKPIDCSSMSSSADLSDSQQDDVNCVPCNGEKLLISALSSISFKKQGLSFLAPDKKDLVDACLPRMNVFLVGHGSYEEAYEDNTIAGLSIGASGSDDFEQFLKCLNQDYVVQSLTLFTCFAGLNINNLLKEFANKRFLAQASYPILFTSGLFASSTSNDFDLTLNVSEQELPKYLYTINKKHLYGPKKIYGDKGMFGQFFEYLNHVESYDVAAKKFKHKVEGDAATQSAAYSYTTLKPEWKKAVDVLTELFKEGKVKQLENITFIKFPNVEWVSLPELDDRIMTITSIKAATAQNGITVPEKVSIVLLQTPYVPYPVILKNNKLGTKDQDFWIVPTIIGEDIKGVVEYSFEEIRCFCDINSFGRMFFNSELLDNLEQSFFVLIKKVVCEKKEYKDVFLIYQHFAEVQSVENNEQEGNEEELEGTNEFRFAMVIYTDSNGAIKRFVYRGRDPELEQDYMDGYKNYVDSIYHNAKHGIQEKSKKIDALHSLFGKGFKSAKEVSKMQQQKEELAKKEWAKEGKKWDEKEIYEKSSSRSRVSHLLRMIKVNDQKIEELKKNPPLYVDVNDTKAMIYLKNQHRVLLEELATLNPDVLISSALELASLLPTA